MKHNPHVVKQVRLLDIDESIADLVYILNFLEIETMKSCEGHLDGIRHPFPWIAINEKDINRLERLLEDFNKERRIRWKVKIDLNSKEWLLRPEISASGRNSLRRLQKDGKELSRFLSRKIMKKEHLG